SPVCRIIDYGKFKFEQEKKAREAKKKQHTSDVKEVKMRYKIGKSDYQVRVNHAKRFLQAGDKVKATVMFRGREIQHADLAEKLLKQLANDLEELADVNQAPKREGRNMMMLLSPKTKKEGGAKAKKEGSNKPRREKPAKPKLNEAQS
ncbi:MAG: translation initiation factor IF-3, partial [Merismopedia sp. SIO2A8]|nr:translation initiation factor IF-3 [Merismopedia sp. SIO2A8]